jgi:hypothetical protein
MRTQPDYIGGPYRDTFGGHFVSIYGRISVRISKKSGYRDPVFKISLYSTPCDEHLTHRFNFKAIVHFQSKIFQANLSCFVLKPFFHHQMVYAN